MDPSNATRFLLDSRLFLDPDAILAVAEWGALIIKWILRYLETSDVDGKSPDVPPQTRGSQVLLARVDRRLPTVIVHMDVLTTGQEPARRWSPISQILGSRYERSKRLVTYLQSDNPRISEIKTDSSLRTQGS